MIILKNLNGDIYTGVDLIYLDTKTPSGDNEADLRVVLTSGKNFCLCGFRDTETAEKVMAAVYAAMLPAGVKNPNHIFVDLKELREKIGNEENH